MQVALIDNDPQQRAQMSDALRAEGWTCFVFDNLNRLAAHLKTEGIDLLVYHWQPAAEGLRMLRAARQTASSLPVLLVAGPSAGQELVQALADGLTDFLAKPMRKADLQLRARVLVSRANPARLTSRTLDFGEFCFDINGSRLTRQGELIPLTHKEFDLALLFFRNLGRPLSRATIHEAVWPREAEFSSRTMDTHVSRVRNKLGLRPEKGFRLAPVYSYGYRLEQLGRPKG
jgi:DNA-binding response OmpR family regulator